MKICFVVQDMSLGGAETVVSEILKEWKNPKDELFLISFFNKFDNRYSFLRHIKNLTVIELGKTKTIDFIFLKKLKTTIDNIKPDAISSHLTCTFYLKAAGLTKKYKTFHTIHSEPSKDLPWIYRLFLKDDFKKEKIVLIGCCDYITKKAISLYKTKCLTIKNCISIEKSNRPAVSTNYPIKFLYIGRFDSVKNVPLLIHGFEKAKCKNTILTLCGFGADEQKIINRVQQSPFKNNIVVVGKENDIEHLYVESDVLCLISKREGLPMTILEGINYGLSFLVSDVGGISEYVHNDFNGLFVDNSSSDDLSKAIKYLAENPQTISAYKRNSFSLKKSIDSKEMASEYKKLLYGKQ